MQTTLAKAVKGSGKMAPSGCTEHARTARTPGGRRNSNCVSTEAALYKAVLCKAHCLIYMPYLHGCFIYCHTYTVRSCHELEFIQVFSSLTYQIGFHIYTVFSLN